MTAATSAKTPDGGGRSPLLFIFLTVFIDLLGFGIVIPLLPIYSKTYGADEAQLGLLFTCFSGMQFLFAPLWGRLSDRIGRKPVLVGGLLGSAISYVLFARAESMAGLFAARLLAGFFGANISTAQAYIADVTTPENRAKGMGLIGAAFGLGFTLGPALGGIFAERDPSIPGWIAAALSLAAALFGWAMLHEAPRERRASARVFGFEEARHALREPRIGTPLLLAFLSVLAFSAFEAMFVRFGVDLFPTRFGLPADLAGATPDDYLKAARPAGYYLGAVGVLSALIQGGLIRRLVPRYGEPALAIAGPMLLGLGLAVIGLAPSFGVVVAGCCLLPAGFGLNTPAVNGLISRAAPADRQGGFLGLNQSLASLARATGPYAAGWLFKAYGPRAPFVASCAVLIVATAIAWRYRKRFGASFTR